MGESSMAQNLSTLVGMPSAAVGYPPVFGEQSGNGCQTVCTKCSQCLQRWWGLLLWNGFVFIHSQLRLLLCERLVFMLLLLQSVLTFEFGLDTVMFNLFYEYFREAQSWC